MQADFDAVELSRALFSSLVDTAKLRKQHNGAAAALPCTVAGCFQCWLMGTCVANQI